MNRRSLVFGWWMAFTLFVFASAVFDAWLYSTGRATISEAAWWFAAHFPGFSFGVGFCFGCLAGHFFWQSGEVYEHQRAGDTRSGDGPCLCRGGLADWSEGDSEDVA